MSINRFVGERGDLALSEDNWEKPQHLLDAIENRRKKMAEKMAAQLEGRAFCATGPGGGIDNSCSSKDGGGGQKSEGSGGSQGGPGRRPGSMPKGRQFRPYVEWRRANEKQLSSLRAAVIDAHEAAKDRLVEYDKKGEVIVSKGKELRKDRDDVDDKFMADAKALREAILADPNTPESLRKKIEDSQAHYIRYVIPPATDGTSSIPVALQGMGEAVRAAFVQHQKSIEAREFVRKQIKENEKKLDKHYAGRALEATLAKAESWNAIARANREFATRAVDRPDDEANQQAGRRLTHSEEDYENFAKTFVKDLGYAAVDVRCAPFQRETFVRDAQKPVHDFVTSVVSPVSIGASAIRSHLTIVDTDTDRANADGNTVRIHWANGPRVYAHELGHVMEHHDPELRDAAIAFRQHRCSESDDIFMKDVFPDSGYSDTETGNRDNFHVAVDAVYSGEESRPHTSFYAGKLYGTYEDKKEATPTGTRHYREFVPHATEVISIGMQMLHDNPAAFARADPEYFDFMVSVVSGEYRRHPPTKPGNDPDSVSLPGLSSPRDGDGDGIVNEEEKNKRKGKKK